MLVAIILVKEPACFRSVNNPSCIDLILTNQPKYFQNSGVYKTGISEFHKLTFTVLKTYFEQTKPRIIKCRDYKHFDINGFRDVLIRELSSNNMQSGDFFQFRYISKMIRGGSRTAVTSKMEHFVIIVNGWKPLTIITKSSILDVAAVLDPTLMILAK